MSTPSFRRSESFATPSLPDSRYHPEFACYSGLGADVTLIARDGMRFRINATALKLASGVFETTLSLPQSAETRWQEPVIDPLDEDSEVLEDLLRIISGKEINQTRLMSLYALPSRLLAAEKWDMRTPLSIMRVLLRTNPDISSYPMRVYWLGCHFGWTDVTSAASKYTCNDDLFLVETKPPVGQVDITDLRRLMTFHKNRKDQMKKHLFGDIARVHERGSSYRCVQTVFNVKYQAFAWRILEEMDHTSPAFKISGDRLRLFAEEAQLNECRCRSCGCRLPLRSRQDIIKQVKIHWANLQQTL